MESQFNLRLHSRLMVMIFIATLIVHVYMGSEFGVHLLWHALVVAIFYAVGSYAMALLVGRFGFVLPRVHLLVKNRIWVISCLGFVAGFLLLGYFQSSLLRDGLHDPLQADSPIVVFLKFAPIWFILTYIVYLQQMRYQHVEQAKRPCERQYGLPRAGQPLPVGVQRQNVSRAVLTFVKGGEEIGIPVSAISHITVEDHYCYIYTMNKYGCEKTDIFMPLKSLLARLPEGQFLVVHRSHAVNLRHVKRVSRQGRHYLLYLALDEFVIPVSRHRAKQVMAALSSQRKGEAGVACD